LESVSMKLEEIVEELREMLEKKWQYGKKLYQNC
jgi:hypothetical protein